MALGGALFLVLLARPFAAELPGGEAIARQTGLVAGWAALALVVCEGLILGLQTAVLMQTLEMPAGAVLGAAFAEAGLVKCVAAALLGACLLGWRAAPAALLLALGRGGAGGGDAVHPCGGADGVQRAVAGDRGAAPVRGGDLGGGGSRPSSWRSGGWMTGGLGGLWARGSPACRWRGWRVSSCLAGR